ncbi:hypothetical protein ACP4OV_003684 [Aristida adscensionis]
MASLAGDESMERALAAAIEINLPSSYSGDDRLVWLVPLPSSLFEEDDEPAPPHHDLRELDELSPPTADLEEQALEQQTPGGLALLVLVHSREFGFEDIVRLLEEDGEAYRNGGFGAVPASAAAVAGLEKRKFHAGGDGDDAGGVTGCAVCLEEFDDGEEVSVVPCARGHEFHPDCIAKWLGQSNMCPLCRHALPTMNVDGY